MKILIAGSRSIKYYDFSQYVPEDVELIITGGAGGIDALAEKYADKHKISKLILRPDYARYGKGAPLIRNKKMVDFADTVIIVWDGKSRGTKFTLEYAREKGKPVTLITCGSDDYC